MFSQRKIGVFLSYLAQGIHILTNLVYVPIMLRILGQTEYGVYQLAAATISNLNILTLGFNSAYIRFYSRYKKDNLTKEIEKLNGMFIMIFAALSLMCFVCGLVIVSNARAVLGNELTLQELKMAQILMLVLVISMSITFLTSVFQSQIAAYEKYIWLKGVDLIGYIINPCVTLPLLLLGYGSIGVVVGTLVVSVVVCLLNVIYTIVKLKVHYSFKCFDLMLFREMSGFTLYVFINIIIEQINWSMDKYLLGRLKGAESVAVYSVGGQIISLYRSFAGTIRGVFVPQINKMVANNTSLLEINALFSRLGRNIFMIVFLMYSGFLIFGKTFIYFWAGRGYDNSYWCALVPMTALIIPLIQGPGIDIQRAMNRHRARSIVYMVIAVANLCLSIVLIGTYGEVGAASGTAIALVLGQGLFMNYYYNNKLGLDMKAYWKAIISFLPGCVILVICGVIINYIFNFDTILKLTGGICLYVLIYVIVMYFGSMNKYEKNIVNSIIKRIWR